MAVATSAGRLTGEQKAAILVVLLGEGVSASLFRHLSRREVARIAREVAALGPIDSALAEQVLHEYYLKALEGPPDQGGPEIARRILAQASISDSIADQLLGHDPDESGDALGLLLETPPDVLARALQDEHPQTAALMLLHLPPRRAALLLAALPATTQNETVLRMTTLKQVRGGVLDEVATALNERLSSQKAQDAGDGLERTVDILKRMARIDAKRVLDELEQGHPEQSAALRERLFTFPSLTLADDRGMQELLRQVDSAKVALALAGADEGLAARFLGNLSERAASMIKEEIEFLGTPRQNEQELARREILELALKLEADNLLLFREPDEGESHAAA